MGVRTWAPRIWIRKRLPRKKVRIWQEVPVLPSYFFIAAEDMNEAPRLFGRLSYSPMLIQGQWVTVGDEDLEGLKAFDQPDQGKAFEDWMARKALKEADKSAGCGQVGLSGSVIPGGIGGPPMGEIWTPGNHFRVRGAFMTGVRCILMEVHKDGEVTIAVQNSAVRLRIAHFLLDPIDPI